MGVYNIGWIDAVELVDYQPSTGLLFWKKRPVHTFNECEFRSVEMSAKLWNAAYAGKEALRHADASGYKRGRVLNKSMSAHIVAWMVYYREDPDGFIDHINGIRSDNRICNLRIATKSQNAMNQRRRITNTSGYKGVHWSKQKEVWQARIMFGGKRIHLGSFHDPKDAHDAYVSASLKYHGEFGRAE